ERVAVGEREELALPVAFPRVNVRGVNDAASAFALLQRVAVEDAGEVVAPVESADDDDVLRAGLAHDVEQALHADGVEVAEFFGVLGDGFAAGAVAGAAAVLPDVPGRVAGHGDVFAERC